MSVKLNHFVYQMTSSRDQSLNQKAQQKALAQEQRRLNGLKEQLMTTLPHEINLCQTNDVDLLNQHIEQLFEEKYGLIQAYIQIAQEEVVAVLQGDIAPERKHACDEQREQMESELRFFSGQLQLMQRQRAALLSVASIEQKQWLQSENTRLHTMNQLFRRHATLLEKIYARHAHYSEMDVMAECFTYRYLTGFSAQWLMQFYGMAQNVTIQQSEQECALRYLIRGISSAANDDYE